MRRFQEQYPAANVPSSSTVGRNVHKYKTHGTSPPQSLDFLRQRIFAEFNDLKQNRFMVRKAMKDMMRRAALRIDMNGQHVEGKT